MISVPIELVVEGGPRPRLAQALREMWAFRGTILAFAERDFRLKYKQAALGATWAVIQPVGFMVIFTVMLGKLAKVDAGDVPYAAFSLSALIAWMYMQNAISFGANTLLTDGVFVRKVYFPREVPVLGAVVSAGVDFAIGLALFGVLGPFLGAHPAPTWLLAPVLGILLAMLAAGVALVFAALNVYYRDFRYALPFALQLWFFASPVAYPLTVVPARWRAIYVACNPAAGVLDGFRRALALGQLPDLSLLAVSFVGALAILFGAYRVFKRLEPSFAEII